MREQTTILTLLQVVVPANTVLTISSEMKILEMLGIVKSRIGQGDEPLLIANALAVDYCSHHERIAATVERFGANESREHRSTSCLSE